MMEDIKEKLNTKFLGQNIKIFQEIRFYSRVY